MRRDVEDKGLKLSTKEGGKAGKTKVMLRATVLEEDFQECTEREEVELATSDDTPGADQRTRSQQLVAKEKARRKKCEVKFSLIMKNRAFRKDWREDVAEDGPFSLCESVVRGSRLVLFTTERMKLRRQMVAEAEKKEAVSLSLFMKVNNLEVEAELSTMTTLCWPNGVWMNRWRKEVHQAWRK